MTTRAGRRVYVFINTPVGRGPYVDKIYKSTPYLDTIYERVKGELMSKRDLERCGIFFPAGPRYQMLPYELPESRVENSNSHPSAPISNLQVRKTDLEIQMKPLEEIQKE